MKKILIATTLLVLAFLGLSNQGYCAVELVGKYSFGRCLAGTVDTNRKLGFWGMGVGIGIFDISTPEFPKQISSISTPAEVYDLFYSDDKLYVADDTSGLRIIDVSDPATPFETGFYDTPGEAVGVFVSGSHAYISDGPSGLRIIDISDPSSPAEVGYYSYGWVNDVFVRDSYAYVAADTSGLRILDVSNPATPAEVGICDAQGDEVWRLNITGSYAYVADFSLGLRVIDISDPASPAETGVYSTPDVANDVYVSGAYVYVAGDNAGLRIINVSDPVSPTETGFYQTADPADGIHVLGSYAYIAVNSGLRIVNVSDPASPLEASYFYTRNDVRELLVYGSYAFATSRDGFIVIDISNPGGPAQISNYQIDYPYEIFVSRNHLYFFSEPGLMIFDISDPSSPIEVGNYELPDGISYRDIYVSGSYAYILLSESEENLQIIDVSNPVSPTKVGSVNIPVYATNEEVYVTGQYAYVVERYFFRIIDISNPASASEVGFLETSGFYRGVKVSGSYAYVADGTTGLRILDISDPTAPFEVGFYDTPGGAREVHISGPYAYVRSGSAGLRVIDVSNPSAPVEVGVLDTTLTDFFVSGFLVYVADADLKIHRFIAPGIIDVQPTGANLSEPSTTDSFTLKLASAPAADVVIDLINTKPTECRLSQSSVTLNDTNFETGVTVTLTAEDDGLLDGKQNATIITKLAVSADGRYSGFNPENIIVSVQDDEAGVGISSVYPTYGTAVQDLPTTIKGIGFIAGTTRVYISDYPDGGNETDITAHAAFHNSTRMSLAIPAQSAGNYNLRVANGALSDTRENAVTFADADAIANQAGKKAIIVAGGGNYPDNDLWYATRHLADHAYYALYTQGYTDDSIFYMSSEASDVNGDLASDVDRDATYDNLFYAVNYWAKALDDPDDPDDVPPAAPAEDLLIYLTGHGKAGTFWITYTANEQVAVTAQTLDGWLDGLDLPGTLTVIYDACESGSFLPPLADENRVVITSTAADERAWFLDEGEISFSYFFWNSIAYNASVTEGFLASKNTIETLQTPLMDDDGDGVTNRKAVRAEPVDEVFLGRKRVVDYQIPVIGEVSADPGNLNGDTASTLLAGPVADVNDVGVSSLWSRILPPFNDLLGTNVPVVAVSTVRLEDPEGDGAYQSAFDQFIYKGVYDIFTHMEDKAGFQATPVFITLPQEAGITAAYQTGDIDTDSFISLRDLILVLKALAGIDVSMASQVDYPSSGIDVDGDNRMGFAEAFYIMGKAAGSK